MDQTDDKLVSIFRTEDPGVLPLATIALDAEGIAYSVRSAGKADTLQWTISQKPTNRPVVMEIVVTADVAAKARDLVVDLEQPFPEPPADPGAAADAADPPTIRLEDAATGIADWRHHRGAVAATHEPPRRGGAAALFRDPRDDRDAPGRPRRCGADRRVASRRRQQRRRVDTVDGVATCHARAAVTGGFSPPDHPPLRVGFLVDRRADQDRHQRGHQ